MGGMESANWISGKWGITASAYLCLTSFIHLTTRMDSVNSSLLTGKCTRIGNQRKSCCRKMQLLWVFQHVFHNDPCLLDICSPVGWVAGFHAWLYRLIQYDHRPLYTLNDTSALTYIDRRHILGTFGIPNCRLTSTKQPISVQGHSTAACQQPNQCNSPNPCLHAESLMSELADFTEHYLKRCTLHIFFRLPSLSVCSGCPSSVGKTMPEPEAAVI